jgi:hypothetical protein
LFGGGEMSVFVGNSRKGAGLGASTERVGQNRAWQSRAGQGRTAGSQSALVVDTKRSEEARKRPTWAKQRWLQPAE